MDDPLSGGADRAGSAPILVGVALGLACFVYLFSLPPTQNKADESFILYEAKRVGLLTYLREAGTVRQAKPGEVR
jgi:hypothetical protein